MGSLEEYFKVTKKLAKAEVEIDKLKKFIADHVDPYTLNKADSKVWEKIYNEVYPEQDDIEVFGEEE